MIFRCIDRWLPTKRYWRFDRGVSGIEVSVTIDAEAHIVTSRFGCWAWVRRLVVTVDDCIADQQAENMKISIGILAHNEAASLERTLDSLFQQSLLQQADRQVEIICVPNGCTDNTAAVARQIFAQLMQQYRPTHVTWKVCELAQPGKPNAWNHYVHQLADPLADYLILMDADIWFAQIQTLDALVDLLEREAEVWVAVDQPIKDVVLKPQKNLVEHLSTFVSELSGSNNAVWLCGQLYCARADILRQIYIPAELSADDGFLYQMVTTNCLTTTTQTDRIARAPMASHVFEAYTNPQQLIKHERWLVVSNITNTLIFEHLRGSVIAGGAASASTLLRIWDQQNPRWVTHLIREKLKAQSGWVSPPAYLWRRFTNLRHKSFLKALLLLPLALVALGLDLVTLYAANRELSKALQPEP
jgi:Zn finger protein HypA/HybF involved in hydrogenase expression